jgi:hypothetical protein
MQRKVRPELQPRAAQAKQNNPFSPGMVTVQPRKPASPPLLNNIRATPSIAQRKTNSVQQRQGIKRPPVMTTPRGRQFSGTLQRAAVEVKAPVIRWFFKGVPARVQGTLQAMVVQVPDFRNFCEAVMLLHGSLIVWTQPPVRGDSPAKWDNGIVYVNSDMDHDDMVNAIVFELTNGLYSDAHKKAQEEKDPAIEARNTEYIEYNGVLIQSPIMKEAKKVGLIEKERYPNPWPTFKEYAEFQKASGHTARYHKDPPAGSKCFITSACVFARGLPDDCEELTTLRTFRDNYIMSAPGGPELIREYYEVAPGIVDRILASNESERILSSLYDELVVPSVMLIVNGECQEALLHYRTRVATLINELV